MVSSRISRDHIAAVAATQAINQNARRRSRRFAQKIRNEQAKLAIRVFKTALDATRTAQSGGPVNTRVQ